MIDEQSSASGHDYASDRSAIGAGEQVQRRAALACTGAYRDTSHVSLLKELGWPTLSKRREYYKICQMYKLQNKSSPAYMVGHLPLNRADNVYALKNNNDICVPLFQKLIYSIFHTALERCRP